MSLQEGDTIWVNLDPAKGTETKKTRPCLIVSNDNYNRHFNTILVVPISTSQKYLTEKKFIESPLFVSIQGDKIHGTALLQHVRAIDPSLRSDQKRVAKISHNEIINIQNIIKQFF